MSDQFKKIIELIKKTGDKVIVFDSNNPDDSYVVMDFDRYIKNSAEIEKKPDFIPKKEEIKNLTEEDLTDKINREISMWKNDKNAEALSEEDKVKKNWQIPPAAKNNAHNIK